jgi:hypothetical protein
MYRRTTRTVGDTSGTAQLSKSAVKLGPTMDAVRAMLCSSTDSFSKRHTTKNSSLEPDRAPSSTDARLSPAELRRRPVLSPAELRRRPVAATLTEAAAAPSPEWRDVELLRDDSPDRGLSRSRSADDDDRRRWPSAEGSGARAVGCGDISYNETEGIER